MVKIVKLEKADEKSKKKWVATFDTGKTTKFGQFGSPDFTLTGDKEARERYRARHRKDLETNDPTRAGYVSFYILWGNSTSIRKNIEDFNKRFG